MGIHICLMDEEYNDHPLWESLRQWNDKELLEAMDYFPEEHCESRENDLIRPKPGYIASKLEAVDWCEESKNRYLRLADLIARYPQYGIYISYERKSVMNNLEWITNEARVPDTSNTG